MNPSKYYQLIPEKVLQSIKVLDDLIKPGIKGYSTDSLKEVISIIATHIQKSDANAPLKMEYIKKLVGQGDRYLMELINLGVVKRSGFARKGVAAYKYCFTHEYQSRYISLPLNNAKLIWRINKVRNEFRKECSRSVRGYSDQVKYLKDLTLVDGYEVYLAKCSSLKIEQYNSIEASAKRIVNGDLFWARDKTSGRFHSNITNLAKGLRPFIRIKGESLVNIDVKNSQPYLSTILLTNPGKVSHLTNNPSFSLLLQNLKVSLNLDVKTYISLAQSGLLYEHLIDEFARRGLVLSRDETKDQVLRILFAPNRMPLNEKNRVARQTFIDLFPTVHKIFSKVRGRVKGDKFSNFKRFSILLQSIESYLILDVILKRIYKELPGTIAITIHDSVMTGVMTNNVEAVKKIIIDELTFFVGFRPEVKIEGRFEINQEVLGDLGGISRETVIPNHYPATSAVTYN